MFQVVDVQTMLLQQYGTLVKSLYYILESTLSATPIMELIILARITGPDPRILLINALFQVKVSNLSFISFQVTAWAGWICRVTTRPKINLQSQTGHPALNSQVHHLLLVSCLFCCLFVCFNSSNYCVNDLHLTLPQFLELFPWSFLAFFILLWASCMLAALVFNKTFSFGQLLWPNAATPPATMLNYLIHHKDMGKEEYS